jgi:hypothetical protein
MCACFFGALRIRESILTCEQPDPAIIAIPRVAWVDPVKIRVTGTESTHGSDIENPK